MGLCGVDTLATIFRALRVLSFIAAGAIASLDGDRLELDRLCLGAGYECNTTGEEIAALVAEELEADPAVFEAARDLVK